VSGAVVTTVRPLGGARAATQQAAWMEPGGAHVSVCLGVAHANGRAVLFYGQAADGVMEMSQVAYKLLVHVRESVRHTHSMRA